MKPINDGGPAFPYTRRYVAPNQYEAICEGGMSLRDYFAGQVLGGLWSRSIAHEEHTDLLSRTAYAAADSMIAEREKAGEES